MGGVEKILLKMDSMAHQELNKPEYRDPKIIEEKIRVGGDIFGEGMSVPGGVSSLVKIDYQHMPKYLVDHQQEFSEIILKA
jgi:hypothetical protein